MKLTSVALLIALGVTTVIARQAIPQAIGSNVARDLRGAIDIHVHSDPDKVRVLSTGLEAARLAQEKGLRAIGVKSPTIHGGLVRWARKLTARY